MVEVIGQDNSIQREVTCNHCGARLRYHKIDVKRQTVRDYGGGSDEYCTIRCPQCAQDVSVRCW